MFNEKKTLVIGNWPSCTSFPFLCLQIISARFPWVRFGTVHKKINLQETNVAWEHERYGMKHIPGFTLSHIENPKSELRGSILDTMWEKSTKFFQSKSSVSKSHSGTSARWSQWISHVHSFQKPPHKETHSFLHNKLKTDTCLWSWICCKPEWFTPTTTQLPASHILAAFWMCKIIDRWKEPQSLLIGWTKFGLQSLFVSDICQVRWIFSSTIPQKHSLSGPLNHFLSLKPVWIKFPIQLFWTTWNATLLKQTFQTTF